MSDRAIFTIAFTTGPAYVNEMQSGGIAFRPRVVTPAADPKVAGPAVAGPAVAREALVDLDRRLAGLARAGGAGRLRVAEALDQLTARGWHHELGFSSLGALTFTTPPGPPSSTRAKRLSRS
jgi:hypothetical protein